MSLVAKHIYIPICFYFNLHEIYRRAWISCIYIPICFYFNGDAVNRSLIKKLIYIPICFYFNKAHNGTAYFRCYIYIPICFYFNVILPRGYYAPAGRFTFQYVSILMHVHYSCYKNEKYLHSNMFLF